MQIMHYKCFPFKKFPSQSISHIKQNFLISSQQTSYLFKVNNRKLEKGVKYISN